MNFLLNVYVKLILSEFMQSCKILAFEPRFEPKQKAWYSLSKIGSSKP